MNLQKTSQTTLFLLLLVSTFLGYQLQHLKFSYDIKDFFPINSEHTQFFESFLQNFSNDDDYILIGIRNEKGIFQQDFLEQVERLTEQIEVIPNIESVQSITHVKEFRRSAFYQKLLEIPYLTVSEPEKYPEDSSRIYNNPLLVDFLVSDDAKSLLLYLQNTELLDEEGCRRLTKDLYASLAGFSFEEVHIAGRCTGQTVYIDMIQREVQVFIGIALLVIVLVLWFTYRSFWGIVLPLSVVGLTVLWTMGIMVLMGKSVDLISNVIPTILMIIGIADAIHLLTHHQHLQAENRIQNNLQSSNFILKKTIKEVGKATLLTTFTTAIGFLTLTTSSFKPLVDLGFYATIGLVIALLLTYTLVPAVLVLMEGKMESPKPKPNLKLRHSLNLQGMFDWTLRHPKSIMLGSAVVTLLAVFGASQIKVNNYLLEDLKKDHFQQQAFGFFEEHFSGARPFELVVTTKDTSLQILDFEVLQEMALVDSFLAVQYGVKSMVSPVVLVKSANQIYNQGRTDFYRLPSTPEESRKITQRIEAYADDSQLGKMVSSSGTMAHISGKIPDWGSHIVRQKNEELKEFISAELKGRKLDYRITGTAHLMDLNNSFLAENVLVGLGIAIVIIGLLFGYLLQSIKMIFLVLIPNILPLLVIAGMMGFAGIDLKISTAIIFIISFGIAVDDSIHFLSRFRREVRQCDVAEAVRRTYLTTGKAIMVTSLILAAGFLTLCSSDFLGTFYIGLLIAVTLLVALLADLLLLPVLLVWFYEK